MIKHIKILIKSFSFFFCWAILISTNNFLEIDNPIKWRFLAELIPFLVIILITLIFIKFIEKNSIKISIFENFIKNSIIGLTIGIIWLGLPIVILYILKIIKLDGYNDIPYMYVWVLSSLLNIIMQEFLIRGYLYQLFKTNYNTIIAIIFTNLLFTLLHGGAFEVGILAILNVFTASILLTIVLECTGTLLAPIIMHFIWNTIGSIIFNLVSLPSDYPHLLNFKSNVNNILYTNDYKIESSLLVFIVNIIFIFIILNFNCKNIKNKKQKWI